jgi:hypothetical protein
MHMKWHLPRFVFSLGSELQAMFSNSVTLAKGINDKVTSAVLKRSRFVFYIN